MHVATSRNLLSRACMLILYVVLTNSSLVLTTSLAEPARRIRIAFAGDSLVDNFWAGVDRVVDANSCLKNNLELGRFARNSTGLTRGDKLYWPREIKRIGETFKPNLFVISIGVNDRQKYRLEVLEFLKGATASKAAVLWFGLPVMRNAVDNNDATEKNKMYADAVAKLGMNNVQYAEPWRLHAGAADTYAASAKGKNGKLQSIRTTDGQHFTTAGEDLLAAFAMPKIVAALSDASIQLGQCLDPQATKGR